MNHQRRGRDIEKRLSDINCTLQRTCVIMSTGGDDGGVLGTSRVGKMMVMIAIGYIIVVVLVMVVRRSKWWCCM